MLILALEASATTASAAIMRDGGLVAQTTQSAGLTHSATLLPIAENLLRTTATALSDIDIFAVSHGPGSFTGIRIGVATIKGLAWASETPCVGVSTLEAMAWNGIFAPAGSIICCSMDARRSEVYNALFEIRDGVPCRLVPDRAISTAGLTAELRGNSRLIYCVGDGAELSFAALSAAGLPCSLAPEPMRHQNAWAVCMAASSKAPGTADELLPLYLRLSQAERERQERLDREASAEAAAHG